MFLTWFSAAKITPAEKKLVCVSKNIFARTRFSMEKLFSTQRQKLAYPVCSTPQQT